MMTLAVDALSNGWQAFLFGLGTVLLLAAVAADAIDRKVNWLALGLACMTFVFFWQSLAQT